MTYTNDPLEYMDIKGELMDFAALHLAKHNRNKKAFHFFPFLKICLWHDMIQKLYLHYSSLKKLPNAFLCSLGKLVKLTNHKEGKQRTWKKPKFSALHQRPPGQFWHRREGKHMDVPAWTGRKTAGHTGNL